MNSAEHLKDEEVLELIRNDDHEAFTELYHRYWRKLFVIALHKIKDQSAAEELAQDILADIWSRRNSIQITTTLNAYLSVALKYKIIDYLARLSHRSKYEHYLSENIRNEDNYTTDWLSFEELRQRLEKAVTELPEKCELIYRLSKEQGLNNRQIAQLQEISEKTVEAHLTRAMKLLRRKLLVVSIFKLF